MATRLSWPSTPWPTPLPLTPVTTPKRKSPKRWSSVMSPGAQYTRVLSPAFQRMQHVRTRCSILKTRALHIW